MKSAIPAFRIILFLVLIGAVAGLSTISVKLWGEKPEGASEQKPLTWKADMTVKEFAAENGIPPQKLARLLELKSKEDLSRPLNEVGNPREIVSKVRKRMTIQAEIQSRNWIKIPLKFGLWIAMLGIVFVFMRRKKITPRIRRVFYLVSIVAFGIILGSDPNPMGTVKDAIVLYAERGIIFPPRLIAFTALMVMVVTANKFICSWGCQFGVLQDFIFRLNRTGKSEKPIVRQFKPAFVFTNAVRISFFVLFTLVAMLWSLDLVGVIDPFKIYNPLMMGALGIAFVAAILGLSFFVYRPWCHFFCPFGLAGWLGEKISVFKIRVDYDTCIACEKCADACPSTVMGVTLKRDRVIPDCFACGTCIYVCPVDAISFSSGKRPKPPEGKFKEKKGQA